LLLDELEALTGKLSLGSFHWEVLTVKFLWSEGFKGKAWAATCLKSGLGILEVPPQASRQKGA
jgi:hypothetical protein